MLLFALKSFQRLWTQNMLNVLIVIAKQFFRHERRAMGSGLEVEGWRLEELDEPEQYVRKLGKVGGRCGQ